MNKFRFSAPGPVLKFRPGDTRRGTATPAGSAGLIRDESPKRAAVIRETGTPLDR